jgi:hypothetical protein
MRMVDSMNPTTQFHPYQRETSVPMAERPVKGPLDKARAYARTNPAKILGGIAAIAIGIGLLRGRRARTKIQT